MESMDSPERPVISISLPKEQIESLIKDSGLKPIVCLDDLDAEVDKKKFMKICKLFDNLDVQLFISTVQVEKLKNIFTESDIVKDVLLEEGKIILSMNNGLGAEEINDLAFQNGIPLNHLLTRKPSLEAEFLEITKNE